MTTAILPGCVPLRPLAGNRHSHPLTRQRLDYRLIQQSFVLIIQPSLAVKLFHHGKPPRTLIYAWAELPNLKVSNYRIMNMDIYPQTLSKHLELSQNFQRTFCEISFYPPSHTTSAGSFRFHAAYLDSIFLEHARVMPISVHHYPNNMNTYSPLLKVGPVFTTTAVPAQLQLIQLNTDYCPAQPFRQLFVFSSWTNFEPVFAKQISQ